MNIDSINPTEKNPIKVLVELDAYGKSGGWFWVAPLDEDGRGPHCAGRGVQVKPERIHLIATVDAYLNLKNLLADCAEELEAHINNKYGAPNIHPAQMVKYKTEMELVNDARRAVTLKEKA